jgi:methionyl-tRNA formyltransferase
MRGFALLGAAHAPCGRPLLSLTHISIHFYHSYINTISRFSVPLYSVARKVVASCHPPKNNYMSLKIVFLGTPEFAVASLDILVKNQWNVVAVVTAADKLGGRGNKQLIQSPVKRFALDNHIPVLQPEKLRDEQFLADIRALQADLFIVVAFRMMPEILWSMPPKGTFNLHASLLPAYRGAAPINWAIINGERTTGLTTFFLKHEIDTGDIIQQREVPILHLDTAGTLHDRLKMVGADLVLETVQAIDNQTVKLAVQDTTKASHAPKLFLANTQIDFNQPTDKVYNFIRGLSPYPTAWTTFEGHIMKIYGSVPVHDPHSQVAGQWISEGKNVLKVTTKDGYIMVTDLQLEGRRRMTITDFLNGYSVGSSAHDA